MLSLVLRIVAFVLFLLAGLNVGAPRVNLIALGLASWVASTFASWDLP